eukprot:TRINITY_DN52_c0_g1_i2.p1 TRINITY_DN52_c0_g1~~TRINITY_DN52_c0_g1_i2.p1  ORF type:complete len:302 (-),score=36.82 TRINITY_DN52_c0_g1_i2:491-1396(-)
MATALVCAILVATWGTFLSGPVLARTLDVSTAPINIRSVTDGTEDDILESVVQNIQLAGIDANAYHFPTFPQKPPGIDLSGAARVYHKKVRLVDGKPGTVGYLLTKAPVAFYNFERKVAGVFGTSFMYQFSKFSPKKRPGEGFTFILTGSPTAKGGKGANLGYGDSGNDQSVAIEFDTFFNPEFDPINDNNHIGFDALDSIRSVVTTANNEEPLMDLVNGGWPVYVWIQFWPQGKYLTFKIQVFISTKPTRPTRSVLEADADLGKILSKVTQSELYVGFTAASEDATIDIGDWAFFSATLQ